jgi:hypothetical protein
MVGSGAALAWERRNRLSYATSGSRPAPDMLATVRYQLLFSVAVSYRLVNKLCSGLGSAPDFAMGAANMKTDLHEIRHYLDAARNAIGTTSDRTLAAALGLKAHQQVHMYRSGKALPSDEIMAKIAETAELDPYEALLRLNIWRCEMKTLQAGSSMRQETAIKIYASKLQEHLRGAAAALFVFVSLFASAGTSPAQAAADAAATVYYGKL